MSKECSFDSLALDDLRARTKESTRKANKTITSLEPAQNDLTAAAPKKVVEVCLTCGTLAVQILRALGSVYPGCSYVADMLSTAIQMEQGREENDIRIVSVHIEIADFISELTLTKSPEDSVKEHFNKLIIEPMQELIRRFSEFSGIYYGPGTASHFRQLQNLCRNLISAQEHRKSLQDFSNEIINLRRKLSSILLNHINTTLDKKLYRIITSLTSIEQAIGGYTAQKLTQPDWKELEGLFKQHLSDLTLSQLLQGQNLGKVLQSTIDERKEIDEQNKAMFDIKFNFILDKFSMETKYIRDWLEKKADEGPHNIIPDPSFQQIWLQTAGKKSSVERRQFIDGLSHYFAFEVKRAEFVGSPADSWTADIICSVPYHAAICDAIDRDASGYISVSEVVVFLQQKPKALGWTNLQWLSYCAYGWHADNFFYSEQLKELLKKMPRSGAYYKCFKHFEKPLRAIQNGLQPLAEDLTPWAAKNMDEMIQQRRGWVTEGIKSGLSKSFYRLEPSMVNSIAGGDQIEWWFFPVAFVLFSYHNDILSGAKGVPEHFLEDAQTSLKTLFETYDARVTELKRIWRRFPEDITKAMKYYANGLFAQYFTVFNVPQVSKTPPKKSKIKFISDREAKPPEVEFGSRLPWTSMVDRRYSPPDSPADREEFPRVEFSSRPPPMVIRRNRRYSPSDSPADREESPIRLPSIVYGRNRRYSPPDSPGPPGPADGEEFPEVRFVSRLPSRVVPPDSPADREEFPKAEFSSRPPPIVIRRNRSYSPSDNVVVLDNPPAEGKAKHPIATADIPGPN